MGIDKGGKFVPLKDIPTVLNGKDQSTAEKDAIWMENNPLAHNFVCDDLYLYKSEKGFEPGREHITFEETRAFFLENGRLPQLMQPDDVKKYFDWGANRTASGYPDFSVADKRYNSIEIRKFVIAAARESEKRYEKLSGRYRVETLAHEQGHMGLHDENDQIMGKIIFGAYEQLCMVRNFTDGKKIQEIGNLVKKATELITTEATLKDIDETVAMCAEIDRCEATSQGELEYMESFRTVELMNHWIKGDKPEAYDEHDVGTLILLFGESILDTKSVALIDINKLAKTSSKKEQYVCKEIDVDTAVGIAILEKAEEMMAGKRVFVKKEERERVIKRIRSIIPEQMIKTAIKMQELAKESRGFKELEEKSSLYYAKAKLVEILARTCKFK